MVWFTAISLSPSRLPFYLPKNFNEFKLFVDKRVPRPQFYASLLFSNLPAVIRLPSQQVAAVVQPCQDQVELERKKGKSWQKQHCLVQWQLPNWRLWSWDSSLQRGRTELQMKGSRGGSCSTTIIVSVIVSIISITALNWKTRWVKVFRKITRHPLMST